MEVCFTCECKGDEETLAFQGWINTDLGSTLRCHPALVLLGVGYGMLLPMLWTHPPLRRSMSS
eukprot:1161909-Pelagomonas_calceolata.AAC.17